MKQILIIRGGGRPKGNTAQLVAAFKRGAEEAGHQVEVVSLIKKEVKAAWDVMPAGTGSLVSKKTISMSWRRK